MRVHTLRLTLMLHHLLLQQPLLYPLLLLCLLLPFVLLLYKQQQEAKQNREDKISWGGRWGCVRSREPHTDTEWTNPTKENYHS